MNRTKYCLLILLQFLLPPLIVNAQPFVHPGILHSREDLERMKRAVADKEEPVYSGYQLFIQDPASQYNYKMQGPLEMVGRNPTVGQSAYDNDANAAHQNAVMWAITGDRRYAEKAIEIINAWSATLKSVAGRDAVLMAGLGPFKMINAAEILRYTHAGWKEADVIETEQHFKEVIYPVLKDYAPFANGNWDAAALKTCMAIGVFCNDRAIFESALRYYTHGRGNGSLKNYIVNAEGQIQESGRDQPHSQLGIGMLAECCAIAWNQGLDLYCYDDNLLLKGFEYVAKYNLGNDDLPFSEWLDRTGKYHHFKISDKGRGQLRPLYEQVYAHYVLVKGLSAPYVTKVVKKMRPEGPGRPGADHPGYGTLLFAFANDKAEPAGKSDAAPTAPAGLVALGKNNAVTLSWIKSIGSDNYIIEKAASPNGPFAAIAKNITTNHFIDTNVKASKQYYYTVVEENGMKRTNAFVQAATAGLPPGWQQTNVGNIKTGIAYYNGSEFSIDAYGNGIGKTSDAFYFIYTQAKRNGSLTMRILPQPSSQFSIIGIALRADTTAGAPFVSLSLYPGKMDNIEEPSWHTKLEARAAAGEGVKLIANGNSLVAPAVTFGRLTGCYWLRLQKKKNRVTAWASYDGVHWQEAGSLTLDLGSDNLLGIAVASGMPNSTNVRLDHLKINDKTIQAK